MNTWIGMGRLTKDPRISTYGDNKKMARFTLACDRRGRQEEGQQTADFISCICYGKTADFADNYLRQGTKIVVTGSIMTGSFEKDGQKVYTTDVLVSQVEFAESKKAGDVQPTQPTQAAPVTKPDANFLDIPDGIEDELPFS